MANGQTSINSVIVHLEKIKARLNGQPTVGAVAAAIAEAKEVIQTREGIASNFAFTLGMVPVAHQPSIITAPQVIETIDAYISFLNSGLSKDTANEGTKPPVMKPFVHPERIENLKRIANSNFDLSRLVRYCEELNTCYAAGCWLSIAMLSRAVLDHVPPIFNCGTFREIANNYAGAKSFKDAMNSLESTTRNISDGHLHIQVRSKESLPTSTQIDCSQSLDLLLGEVVRILEK